jgi:CBS-domain-containing membrane protein
MIKQEEKDDKRIKDDIIQIYHNYGIDTFDIDDDDIKRVIRHYKNNPKSLHRDIIESEKHMPENSEGGIINT